MYSDYLRDECYSQIARIASLLAFYDFELSEPLSNKFENNRLLFYVGNDYDLTIIYFNLYDVEQQLLQDIYEFYKTHWDLDSLSEINIWQCN